jgi:hypothetical protein
MVRHAIPGDYHLQFDNMSLGTCQVEVFFNWGKDNESRRMFTLSGDGKGGLMDAGVVKFEIAQP